MGILLCARSGNYKFWAKTASHYGIAEQNSWSQEWNELGDFSQWKAASPAEIRQHISKKGYVLDAQIQQLLEDYEYFDETGEVKNFERLLVRLDAKPGQ
jgi:hypothetical protein